MSSYACCEIVLLKISSVLSYFCSDTELKSDKSPYLYTGVQVLKTPDPLAVLAKQMGGSKRNALLKWCQHKLATYPVCYHGYCRFKLYN